MSAYLKEIIEFMEEIAPSEKALDWDNSGLQLGEPYHGVNRVLLALDATPQVLNEALEMSADLIITHHPLFFRPLRRIDFSTPTGGIVGNLIAHKIALLAAHTNLDCNIRGTGRALAEKIGLKEIKPYTKEESEELNSIITGRYDPTMPKDEVINNIKKSLRKDNIRVINEIMDTSTVAVIPGSGGSLLGKLNRAFDLIVTGEASYHQASEALNCGQVVALVGHYTSEKPVMYYLADILRNSFKNLTFKVAKEEKEPYTLI